MLRVSKAILHVFDFETGTKYFSQSTLDLEDRQTKSYVQRRLRKITANPESRHGEFAPTSNFAGGLQEYAHGDVEFVEFSHQIAQWFWEELRRADDVEQCDLLVADYIDTDAGQTLASAAADDEDAQAEAFEGEGRRLFAIVLLPMMLIFLQKEAGSALVYTALFLALYREGLSGIFLGLAFISVVLFVMALSLADTMWGATNAAYWAIATVITFCMCIALLLSPKYRSRLFSWGLVGYAGVYLLALLFNRFFPFDISFVAIGILALLIGYCLWMAVKRFARRYLLTALLGIGCVLYSLSVSFVFDNVLQPHQRGRIAVALGLKEDLKGMGYNVNQAKIAIGSGGLTGKGFLQGTQTKLSYVPEQDTDFIFCTVGEEHGFLGSTALLLFYLLLILRFFYLAERQVNAFGRVYGYCVGSIFLFHLAVNVGMVLGLVPVIGIPLPFFSYGGSSLWGFTILLFIFVRIDADRKRERSLRPF